MRFAGMRRAARRAEPVWRGRVCSPARNGFCGSVVTWGVDLLNQTGASWHWARMVKDEVGDRSRAHEGGEAIITVKGTI
jgi:hypothetical protein